MNSPSLFVMQSPTHLDHTGIHQYPRWEQATPSLSATGSSFNSEIGVAVPTICSVPRSVGFVIGLPVAFAETAEMMKMAVRWNKNWVWCFVLLFVLRDLQHFVAFKAGLHSSKIIAETQAVYPQTSPCIEDGSCSSRWKFCWVHTSLFAC